MRVIPATEHGIQPDLLNNAAVAVVRRLREADYEAYIVGGAVRDLLLGIRPKDFDVATNATPEQVHGLFRGARIIGRRFQIVHVRYGREIIEVTTYRGHHESPSSTSKESRQSDKGLLLRDNVYGTLEEDAIRRDLTVNSMYYDPDSQELLDQLDGLQDINAKLIRIIGEPEQRYREDPVRMLRVLRFSARLQFAIEKSTSAAIAPCKSLLGEVPAARLFDEFLKLFMSGNALATFHLLLEHHLLDFLLPEAAQRCREQTRYTGLVALAMDSTDRRVRAERPVTPAFLLAAMLWPALQKRSGQLIDRGDPPQGAINAAGQQVTAEACQHMSIPKRFSIPMREMWEMQPKLERQQPKRIKDLLANRRFRAAYDLLLLREQAGEDLNNSGDFWTEQQRLHPELVGSAPAKIEAGQRRRPARRRRRRD